MWKSLSISVCVCVCVRVCVCACVCVPPLSAVTDKKRNIPEESYGFYCLLEDKTCKWGTGKTCRCLPSGCGYTHSMIIQGSVALKYNIISLLEHRKTLIMWKNSCSLRGRVRGRMRRVVSSYFSNCVFKAASPAVSCSSSVHCFHSSTAGLLLPLLWWRYNYNKPPLMIVYHQRKAINTSIAELASTRLSTDLMRLLSGCGLLSWRRTSHYERCCRAGPQCEVGMFLISAGPALHRHPTQITRSKHTCLECLLGLW